MNSQRNLAANPEAHGYGRDAQAARWRIRHALTLLCPALAGSATAPSPTVPRALLAALLLAPLTEPLAAEFHVATTGSDANPGTEAKPFATLERARDEIRKLKQTRPLKEAIAVVVHGGVYHLVQPLVFTPEDSGTPDAPIVYQAAGGAEPVLSGGVAIAGWTKTAEGRWQTTLPPVAAGQWRFAQLYVDDQRRFRPVWPKEGYFFIAGRVPPSTPGWNEDGFRFRKGEIDAGWHNLSDVEAVIFHAWTISRLPIKHVDVPNSLVRFTGCTQNDSFAALTKSQWYRLENVREALQTGQWYLDRMTGVLTYAPLPGEESDSSRVIAPRLRQVVELRGDIEKGRFVEHITLRGLTFAHTAWNTPANGFRDGQGGCQEDAAVMAVNARACTLERCIVRHTGNHGVQFGAGCSSCRADGCEFFDCGMGGVKIGTFAYPNEPDARRWADNCTVRDTLVTGCGRVYPGAVGLLVGHANHCTLEQNEVRDQYYSGVSVGWRWEKGFSPAHHNLVVRNHLHHLGCGVLSDMAGIYTLGQSPGTVLAGNHIHDVNRSRYGGWGIYFDAWSSSITAQGNLVYRTQDAGLHQNYAQENIVRGNLFAFGRNGAFRISDLGKSGPLLLEGNVFVWRGAPFVEELPRGPLDAKVTFRRNLYWSMDQAAVMPGDSNEAAWKQREPDGAFGPLPFVNVETADFRLREGTRVLANGFVPLDPASAGRLTQIDRTAQLPAVPHAFPPAPPVDAMTPIAHAPFGHDFEADRVGDEPLDFGSWANSPGSIVVTEEAASHGRRCLKFTDTQPSATEPGWQPHTWREAQMDAGLASVAYDIRMEANSHPVFECRQYEKRGGSEYRQGPAFEITRDGALKSGGKELVRIPQGQWVRVEVRCPLGPAANGRHDLLVTLPGEAQPRRFEGLAHPDQFNALNWMGWMAIGAPGAVFYVDNVRLDNSPR